MSKISTNTVINEGGREGLSYAPNKSFEVKTSMTPKAGYTNPEQLFAAGFSACFNSALTFVLQKEGLGDLKRSMRAEVSLVGDAKALDFNLEVTLIGKIEGLSKEKTLELMKITDSVCPYSKAVQGNIPVHLEAETGE